MGLYKTRPMAMNIITKIPERIKWSINDYNIDKSNTLYSHISKYGVNLRIYHRFNIDRKVSLNTVNSNILLLTIFLFVESYFDTDSSTQMILGNSPHDILNVIGGL